VLRGEPREDPKPRSSHNSSATAAVLNLELLGLSCAFAQDLYDLVEMLKTCMSGSQCQRADCLSLAVSVF
jgi:hypothetical protein